MRGCKEGSSHDPSMNMPTEQKASESSKQKIAKIHDMFPAAMKENIAKILQFYDDDESKAVDALTRDGGREALSNWADSNNSKSKNNKNKKKKKKAKKDSGAGMTATASFDADDSSSLHSGGNVEADGDKECQRAENGSGVLSDSVDKSAHLDSMLSNHERLTCNEQDLEHLESERGPKGFREGKSAMVAHFSQSCDRNPDDRGPLLNSPERQGDQGPKKDKYRAINEGSSKSSPRQRTSSFRRSKSSSINEDVPSQTAAAPTKRGYDKCKKDLNRQTISLQRIRSLVEKGFEEASKKAKAFFNDAAKQLEKRQIELETELQERRLEAINLLESRQNLSVELKRRIDRTPSLSEAEWNELRSDVKQFVTERKYDDDLGKTIWFQWEDITEIIQKFGEVPPVKNVYSQRSNSALGNCGISNNPEPSPTSSLANEENESSADKNDVGHMSDAGEDEVQIPGKEEVPAFNKTHPTENRTRVYSNKQYERSSRGRFPNRGTGYYRGNNRGGGYNRPQFRNNNNYHFNRHNSYNYDDYKNHPYPERDGRIHDGSAYPADRNMNTRDNKINRNHGRGQHMNYRYNSNRGYNRGNAGAHRFNAETEPTANAASANIDKANVMNGYVNNNNN
ncbi:spermatogenesis-associated serine-rich protein 2 [Caerostris darwini]|uniref:Spermatogenesis-associated serine-rich protein 2 n=1 Tax=Caerostris darwini TaxID=1538125 RepID=A0AAV4WBV9_9ARAC|nr:spermatogenesis-associated serine-rich protein 2 [Caerostris darwini]